MKNPFRKLPPQIMAVVLYGKKEKILVILHMKPKYSPLKIHKRTTTTQFPRGRDIIQNKDKNRRPLSAGHLNPVSPGNQQ